MIDERSRHLLFLRLEELLGSEEATTLMEHMPPVGWADVATKRDLDHLAEKLDATTVLLRQEMVSSTALLRQEIAVSEHRVIATLRGDLNAQTRTMIFAMVGVVLSISTVSLFQ